MPAKRLIRECCLILSLLLLSSLGDLFAQDEPTGLILNKDGAFPGYTLLAPQFSTSTYLIDMQGRVVHQWQSEYRPGQVAYLLENGHLLRAAHPGAEHEGILRGGGAGGKVQEFTWEGELIWEFTLCNDQHRLHHDIERLPNGNTLMIAWERKTPKQAAAAGRNPDRISRDGLWSEKIIEVQPTSKTTGEIVWEWQVWDHLIQDRDPQRNYYGQVADHPERININPFDWTERMTAEMRERLEALGYMAPRPNKRGRNPDWLHINSVAYDPESDRIVLSVLGLNEIWVIDHGISTQEAAGPKGDLLIRWGNPQTHGKGEPGDQQLFAQHDAHWIAAGLQGAGHLLVFNNGRERPTGNFSSVDEIALAGEKAEVVWSYGAAEEEKFFSPHLSGAQRLANGNTFICSGSEGRLFEVTGQGRLVWEYRNPVSGERKSPPDPEQYVDQPQAQNCVFRAYRYGPDYPGLKGGVLKPGKFVEALLRIRKPGVEPVAKKILVFHDPEAFGRVVSKDARLEKIAGGIDFTEGPVWFADGGGLLFGDLPADEIKKRLRRPSGVLRGPIQNTYGNLLDRHGLLLSCEPGSRRVIRMLEDGREEVLADLFEGKRLNGPSDLVMRSDGVLWFTDPGCGRELEPPHVFRLDPETGALRSVVQDVDQPQGICLSPDEKTLYMADAGQNAHIRAFNVEPDGSLTNGRVFCAIEPGSPCGIRCDRQGHLFSSAGDGVQVFLPTGERIGKILLPEPAGHLHMGGENGKTLFITTRTSLYSLPLK